ncbi:SDR family oxidoreductase [Glutamicibacter arilaitensis]|uniref:SDR family oxidoreductase n=1 Tax=Glutamicibacter arilaitensis TaxID=256701 RepID=A0A4Y8TTT4_9MICC|nr:SDR family oxidoreductase [Glutamicibacter arilaitensis]TFH54582.1 SDR family oxidoreductase [Glutamicibacter arilaitensis]
MKIAITGATGQLGNLVIDALLECGADPAQLVAIGRSEEKLAPLDGKGLETRVADYNVQPELVSALEGVDKLLLISSSEVGQRVAQHENVINAAKQVDVSLIAYTSIANAMTGGMELAEEHIATERLLAGSGIGYVLLRNGWYIENYTDQLMGYLNSGVILGAAGEGKISAATRADFAEAAAAVLLADEEQNGKIYELGSDKPFTLAQLAGAVGAAAGQDVAYQDMDPEQLEKIYADAGVPGPFAHLLVDTDVRIREGALEVNTGDLATLIGRAPASLGKVIKDNLAK